MISADYKSKFIILFVVRHSSTWWSSQTHFAESWIYSNLYNNVHGDQLRFYLYDIGSFWRDLYSRGKSLIGSSRHFPRYLSRLVFSTCPWFQHLSAIARNSKWLLFRNSVCRWSNVCKYWNPWKGCSFMVTNCQLSAKNLELW